MLENQLSRETMELFSMGCAISRGEIPVQEYFTALNEYMEHYKLSTIQTARNLHQAQIYIMRNG